MNLRKLKGMLLGTLVAGDSLAYDGTAKAWRNKPQGFRAVNTQADSYTFASIDRSTIVLCTKGTANTLTVPANATTAFPIGTKLRAVQMGAGLVTVAAAGAATIRKTAATLKVLAQYGTITLEKVGTDEWVLTGELAAS